MRAEVFRQIFKMMGRVRGSKKNDIVECYKFGLKMVVYSLNGGV